MKATILSAELYRSVKMEWGTIAKPQEVVFPLSDRAATLSPADIELLGLCQHFDRLEAHAKQAVHLQNSNWSETEALGRLQQLAGLGGLITSQQLVTHCRQYCEDKSSESKITWLAFPTKGRPKLLRRALRSYIDNLAQFGRSANILVADDSPDSKHRDQNLELLRTISQQTDNTILYIGPRERHAYLKWLTASGDIPLEVARFALFGMPDRLPSYGANRNTILLQTLGHLVLCADDDTVCRLGSMSSKQAQTTLRMHNYVSPEEIWFYEDRARAIRSVQWENLDLLSWHERLLGKALPSLVQTNRYFATVDFDTISDRMFDGLCNKRGRVGIVTMGVVGDSAMSSASGLQKTLNEATRERLVMSEESYQLGLSSREVVRQALFPAVSNCP